MRYSLLLLAVSAFAADTAVQITDTIYNQSPTPFAGTVVVSWPAFVASGGTVVAAGSRTFTITAGALNLALYSNAGAAPSFRYVAKYYTSSSVTSVAWIEQWYVPASGACSLSGGTVCVLQDVRRASTVGIGYVYQGTYAGRSTSPHLYDSALFIDATSTGSCATSGGASFAVCTWNGSTWVTSGGGGGGGSGGTWGGGGTGTWGGQ